MKGEIIMNCKECKHGSWSHGLNDYYCEIRKVKECDGCNYFESKSKRKKINNRDNSTISNAINPQSNRITYLGN